MRITPLITLCLSITSLFGQVPNGGFEQWTTRSIDQLDDWTTAGLVEKSSDATHGNHSIKLSNMAATEAFGLVTNADLSQNLSGGQPYSEIPLVMKFDVKYNLAPGDIAKVLAIFKLEGQPIGQVDFTMNGTTADTFQNISYAIQWLTQVNPDTLIVVISSVDLASPSYNGDGYVIIDNIEFKSFSTTHDSINNRSFEAWSPFEISHPEGWYTTDLYLNDVLHLPVNFGSASKASHVQSGNESLLLSNIKPDTDILPGVAITGKSVSGIEQPSFAVNRRWVHFQGLYKYQPDNGDKATLAATLFSNGTLVGAAQLTIADSSRMDEYTYFSTPIQYLNGTVPDSATVIVSSADLENPVGEHSKLWVDNLSFTDHTASISIQELIGLQVYPNPVTETLHIHSRLSSAYSAALYDLSGQLVMQSQAPTMDVRHLSQGIYILKVQSEGINLLTERVVKL